MLILDLIELPKNEAVDLICASAFDDTLGFALSPHEKAWKAAWLLNQALKQKELRLEDKVFSICKAVPGKPSGHMRELLKLLENVELSQENEGPIFDIAISCWEDLGAQSSCRMVAFRLMLSVGKKHPELIPEIQSMSDERFLNGLSNGIKNSVLMRLRTLSVKSP